MYLFVKAKYKSHGVQMYLYQEACTICDLGPDILSGWQTKFVSGVNDHEVQCSSQIFCYLKQCRSKICVGDYITTTPRSKICVGDYITTTPRSKICVGDYITTASWGVGQAKDLCLRP